MTRPLLSRGHAARRALVTLTVALSTVMALPVPSSLAGTGATLTVFLVVADCILIAATGALAFGTRRRLDERQCAVRDHAYRVGLRLLALGVLLLLIFGEIASPGVNQDNLLATGLDTRRLVVFLELLAMTPTLVVAWMETDAPAAGARRIALRAALTSILLVAVMAGLYATAIDVVPVRVAAGATDKGFLMSDASCNRFIIARQVGSGFGATVRAHVEVCWNGRTAFTFGDPSLGASVPPLASLPAQSFDQNLPDLTSCDPFEDDTNFASVSEKTCSALVDASGTLHYSFHAVVHTWPGALARPVDVRLDVNSAGRVLRFG